LFSLTEPILSDSIASVIGLLFLSVDAELLTLENLSDDLFDVDRGG